MRLRNIPGAREEMLVNPYVVHDPEACRGRWQEFFGNQNPIHLEIGTGKGRFLTELAAKNPDINFLGMEKYASVLLRAVQKQEALALPNLRFLCADAKDLEALFSDGEIARIYLNFSDPWPKDRHAKRRLTACNFLELYARVLSSQGALAFKTDNRPLFDFSLAQAKEAGWRVEDITYDLHESPFAPDNIMTEYEERFSSLGNPICRFLAHPR